MKDLTVSSILEPVKSRLTPIVKLEVNAKDWLKWRNRKNLKVGGKKKMKQFMCIWFEPTYVPMNRIENENELINEDRGFSTLELKSISELKVKSVLHFEDLIIIRIK